MKHNALIKEIPNGDSITKPIEGEFGILVPDMSEEVNMNPEDISDEERVLADQIIALLDSDEKMKHYSEKAYERALFYTPEKYQASAHEIFKRYE